MADVSLVTRHHCRTPMQSALRSNPARQALTKLHANGGHLYLAGLAFGRRGVHWRDNIALRTAQTLMRVGLAYVGSSGRGRRTTALRLTPEGRRVAAQLANAMAR